MKIDIAGLSDTHNNHNKIKNIGQGDLIIHAGDFSSRGYKWESEQFLKWYSKLPYSAKILVCGNHELGIENDYEFRFKQMCKEAGVIYLNDSSVELQFLPGKVFVNENIPDLAKVKIHGSPITPWFFDWAWNRSIRDDGLVQDLRTGKTKSQLPIKPHWDLIPADTNILVTHGPPHGILDELVHVDGTPKGQFAGCPHLRDRIKEIKPDLHIFGHIHCAAGEKHIDGTSYYNVAICDEMYMASNPVTRIEYALPDLKKETVEKS